MDYLFLNGIKIAVTSVSTDDTQILVLDKIQNLKERERYIPQFREEIAKEII